MIYYQLLVWITINYSYDLLSTTRMIYYQLLVWFTTNYSYDLLPITRMIYYQLLVWFTTNYSYDLLPIISLIHTHDCGNLLVTLLSKITESGVTWKRKDSPEVKLDDILEYCTDVEYHARLGDGSD